MTLVLTRRAARQLDDILTFLIERSPQGAANVRLRFGEVFDLLGAHPSAGGETSRPGVRRMVVNPFPYAVFYPIRRKTVVVQRIRHTSRRPV